MDRATALKATYKAGRRGGDSIARRGCWNHKIGGVSAILSDFLKVGELGRVWELTLLEWRCGALMGRG